MNNFLTHFQREAGVFENRHVRPNGIRLKDHAKAALVGWNENILRGTVNSGASDGDQALGWFFQTSDRAQGGGFAATTWAKQGKELPLGHFKTDVLSSLDDDTFVAHVFGMQSTDI